MIQARRTGTTTVLGTKRVTVRVRKNAQTLSPAERDRFVAAFGTLNGGGAGRFRDFRDMHVSAADAEAHGNVGFLPWHRAYLLDLERELQAIDPSVTLPYWRFDQAAPNVFTREFMGVSNAVGRVEFTAGHPFNTWRTDGALGISRTPLFPTGIGARRSPDRDPDDRARRRRAERLLRELRRAWKATRTALRTPASAASSARSRRPRAIRCSSCCTANVDRLWAKWQWVHRRTSPADARAFAPAVPNRVGHRLPDTMWPWNGVTAPPRPSTAPGGTFAPSRSTAAPGLNPIVRAMIDYQAVGGGAPLGFAYDDVPFEL